MVTLFKVKSFQSGFGVGREAVYMIFLRELVLKNSLSLTLAYAYIGLSIIYIAHVYNIYFSHNMRFPTMWYVRPAKAQTSLRICAV